MRDESLRDLSVALARPVRWATFIAPYEGSDRTLEVFNADAPDQRRLLRQIRPFRGALEGAAGGPVIVIFHTRKESARLYADVI